MRPGPRPGRPMMRRGPTPRRGLPMRPGVRRAPPPASLPTTADSSPNSTPERGSPTTRSAEEEELRRIVEQKQRLIQDIATSSDEDVRGRTFEDFQRLCDRENQVACSALTKGALQRFTNEKARIFCQMCSARSEPERERSLDEFENVTKNEFDMVKDTVEFLATGHKPPRSDSSHSRRRRRRKSIDSRSSRGSLGKRKSREHVVPSSDLREQFHDLVNREQALIDELCENQCTRPNCFNCNRCETSQRILQQLRNITDQKLQLATRIQKKSKASGYNQNADSGTASPRLRLEVVTPPHSELTNVQMLPPMMPPMMLTMYPDSNPILPASSSYAPPYFPTQGNQPQELVPQPSGSSSPPKTVVTKMTLLVNENGAVDLAEKPHVIMQ